MALKDFKFPGVELHQEFVETPVVGESQLGVVVVGNKFKSNTTSWVYGGTASSIDFSDDDYCTVDEASDVSVYVTDGLFKGFEATASSTGVKVSGSTMGTSNKSATVTFDVDITASTVFGTLPPTEGDTVDITGTGSAVPCIISSISANGKTIVATVTGTTAISGSSVTKVDFYKVVPDMVEVTDATVSGATVTMPATVTAKVGGQTLDSTLQEGTYNVSVTYDKPTKFSLGAVGSLEEIRQEFGEANRSNDMALALHVALQASQTNIVYYLGILDDSADGYTAAMDFLDKYDTVYSVVPLTYDVAKIQACITAAEASAKDPESKIRRTVWYGLETPNSNIVQGLIDTRKTIGSNYRAQAVWADDALFKAIVLPNYILAAAPAGMRSYEPAYRPISNLGYSFLSLYNTHGLTKSQLTALGQEGIWIIDNNYLGTPINKRQITTAVSNNLNLDEESIVANADSIALTLCHVGENLVGCSNINPMLLKALRDTITNIMNNYTVNLTGNAYIGPQLLSWSLDALFQHPTMLDHIYATITCEPPKPFNRFVMTLRIV